ncbi:MAG: beta-ketoacyl-ACP synthase 3 [Acidimicrobiia bacterium]|nr:beta-ketoacyl-ACP synthase 3 [Acidimicrobiia bacterium]
MPGASIIGWGAALARTEVTNADFEQRLATTDTWIVERTGIRSRRIGGTTAELGTRAAIAALERAAVPASSVDMVLLATSTPDETMPATAATIAGELGADAAAMDVNVACSGFAYALVTAFGLLSVGVGRTLVIGSETLSRIVDPTDRSTAVIFADGAGAVVLDPTEGPTALLGHDLGNDASGRHLITAPLGGPLRMEGREVFRRAVRATVASAQRAMADADMTADEVALVVPHQANLRIIEAAADRLGVGLDRWVVTVGHTGTTSAA